VSLNQLGRCVQLLYTKRSSFDLCIQTYQELTAGPESKLRRLLFQRCITYLPMITITPCPQTLGPPCRSKFYSFLLVRF